MTNAETGWRRSISRILTLNCRDAAPMVSQAMDEPLSRADRWALRLHLVVCAPCRRYRRQLASIRSILTDLGRRAGEDAVAGPPLPDALRQRLRAMTDAD